jgi:hypothetical protein
MSITDYLISAGLILLVVRQLRGRRITTFNLLLPLGIVVYAGQSYLHGLPTGGNDLALVGGGIALGALLGTLCGLFTSVRPDAEGRPFAKAGWVAGGLWIVGVGSRLAFELYATHGGGASIAHFSASHGITSVDAWGTALILMAFAEVLGRTAVLAWRAYTVRRDNPALVEAEIGSGSGPRSGRPQMVGSGIMGAGERAF